MMLRTVVHTTADILLPLQRCSSSAITTFVVVIMINNRNIKCVNISIFHLGRGHHIVKLSDRF